jgi:Flp pilus assembly protein TadB
MKTFKRIPTKKKQKAKVEVKSGKKIKIKKSLGKTSKQIKSRKPIKPRKQNKKNNQQTKASENPIEEQIAKIELSLDSSIKSSDAPSNAASASDSAGHDASKTADGKPRQKFEDLLRKVSFSGKNILIKKDKTKMTETQKKHLLNFYLEKTGVGWAEITVRKRIVFFALTVACLSSLYWLTLFIFKKLTFTGLMLFLSLSWVIGFGLLWLLSWGVLYLYLDFRLYKRRREIEEILPDFLQLVSSNISAGMPMDRALWYAIRPKFGILAREMETVAKATMAGEDLKDFSEKYDSALLTRSINLVIEGMDAGGEMAELLNKIANNFEEIKIMKKEMASSVTTYVIFISFSSIVAAPVLFALATELLIIIQGLTSNLDVSATSSFFSISSNAISISDFRIFAVLMLFISSFMSASVVSTISRGNIKDGLKYIPFYVLATVGIYLVSAWLLHGVFSSVFANMG